MSDINKLDNDQIELAKALANPIDHEKRYMTVNTLQSTLSSLKSPMSDLQMLKLWKALYYCMWLCDKTPIQKELGDKLSSFIHHFSKHKIVLQYITIFYKTILREWSLLDQHRMNKFYLLLRSMIFASFEYIRNNNYKQKYIRDLVTAIDMEILQKTPNGLRFHIADIYLEELYSSTKGNIKTNTFLELIQPFLMALKKTAPGQGVFTDRVASSIYVKFLEKYAKESFNKDSNTNVFLNVDTKRIQAILFDMASSEDIQDSNRKKLYELHAAFSKVTGKDFINEDELMLDEVDDNEESMQETEAKAKPQAKPEVKATKRKLQSMEHEMGISRQDTYQQVKISKSKIAEEKKDSNPNLQEPPMKKTSKHDKVNAESKIMKTDTKSSKDDSSIEMNPTADFLSSKKFIDSKPGYIFQMVSSKLVSYYFYNIAITIIG